MPPIRRSKTVTQPSPSSPLRDTKEYTFPFNQGDAVWVRLIRPDPDDQDWKLFGTTDRLEWMSWVPGFVSGRKSDRADLLWVYVSGIGYRQCRRDELLDIFSPPVHSRKVYYSLVDALRRMEKDADEIPF